MGRRTKKQLACPFAQAMEVMAGKWKGLILFTLKNKTVRFNELQEQVADVSNRMLILSLKELERDGLIIRTVSAKMPIEVRYSLSEIGEKLIPVLDCITDWGVLYQEYLVQELISYKKL